MSEGKTARAPEAARRDAPPAKRQTADVSYETIETLRIGCTQFGIAPPDFSAFETYYKLLADANARVNLTAITGARETAVRHFLDSLAPLAYSPLGTAPPGATLIDVGSGAGFPGLPLKIARPDLAVTLLDASEKRVAFLAETARALGLEAGCVHARAEEYALRNLDVFDFAVSRAVADLRELTELCLPFVRTGGAFLAMKSQSSDDEITAAATAIATLGGALEAVSDYALPDGTPRRIAVIRKQSATPEGYPRKYKKISTKPL